MWRAAIVAGMTAVTVAAASVHASAQTTACTGSTCAVAPRVLFEQAPTAAHRPASWVRGPGFDSCGAPSVAAMRAWRKSFVAAAVYIGGVARACPNDNLTASWVHAVHAMGWRLIPTYVGPQAPCTTFRHRFSAKNAVTAGQSSARNAAASARALGISRGAPIYFDLEPYRGGATCVSAVVRFVQAWSSGLRANGYLPCLYAGAVTGIRDVGGVAGGVAGGAAGRVRGRPGPAAIWYAHWDKRADVYGDPLVGAGLWPGHRRIKQDAGGHKEKHGGVTITVDSDMVDGPVY
jgi:hypothetical protein